MTNKLWFIQVGMAYAGMTADVNPPELFYGTEQEAGDNAYHQAVEESSSWQGMHGIPNFTDDEEVLEANPDDYEHIDELCNHLDYHTTEVTLNSWKEFSDNWGVDGIIQVENTKSIYKSWESQSNSTLNLRFISRLSGCICYSHFMSSDKPRNQPATKDHKIPGTNCPAYSRDIIRDLDWRLYINNRYPVGDFQLIVEGDRH